MLYGREAEQARIAQLLAAATSGQGGSLVVVGEPGAGKSLLLERTSERARDEGELTVLRTQGIESEAPLAFAALQRLLRPLLPLAGRLPAPQAQALRVALGEEAGDQTDRFLVFLATLSLLAEAAESRPVLAVVDDAHWLDDASAAALLFAARRLQLERVALLFGARTGDVRTFDSQDLPTLEVAGLGLGATVELLRAESGAPVSPEVAAELLASTGGNPLALAELPRLLSAEQLTGRTPLPERLPATAGVERAFLDRARRLSPAAQRLLLIAAADDSTDVVSVTTAGARLGVGADALAEAETSGLVRVEGRSLVMRHPLVRSAVYSGATSVDRRAVHAVLAESLTRVEDADRRAWHLAASVDAPDEAVVGELEAAASRAEQRGGHEAASAAWQRAADLSTDPAERGRRLYHAARGAWLAGQARRATGLAEAARDAIEDPALRADAIRLRARIEWNTGSVKLGHRMLMETVPGLVSHDPDRAREMAMFGAAIAAFGGDSGIGVDPRDYADLPDDASARQRCFAELLLGLVHVDAGEWAAADKLLRGAFATGEELQLDDQDLLPNLGIAALHLGDTEAAADYHERLLVRARATGAMVMVLYSLTRMTLSDLARAQWSTAAARQSEALDLAATTGLPVLEVMPRATLTLLSALRGGDEYDDHLAAVQERMQGPLGILESWLRDVLRWAQGLHAGPRTAAGFHHLAQVSHHIVQRQAGIDRLEAAVQAGQTETAALWVSDLEEFGAATGQSWPAAFAAHGRALLASGTDDAAADELFEEALRLHTAGPVRPFDQARSRLAYGEHLRRTRRRVAARDHLRAALQTFEDLGAGPWADRAGQELRASGETARRREVTTEVSLTPTELQVAQLVQQGLSNREVAAQLFVSPRTVDFHLRNVFTKTGVTSRLELARLTLG